MFGFKFSNLCGTVYRQGNLLFTPDGNSLLSPVGNRVTVFDLVNNSSYTLPFENRKDVERLEISPDGRFLIAVDVEGYGLLINFPKRVVLHHFNFKEKVYDIKYSPDGKFIAVTHGKKVQVWKAPGLEREYAPFELHRTYTGHYDIVTTLSWSHDSLYIVAGSHDMTTKIFSLHPISGFVPFTLAGHKDHIIGCFLTNRNRTLYTVSRDGTLITWGWESLSAEEAALAPRKRRREDMGKNSRRKAKEAALREDDDEEEDGDEDEDEDDEEEEEEEEESAAEVFNSPVDYTRGKWNLKTRHFFSMGQAKVTSAAFHPGSQLLVVGFSSGIFGLYELPFFTPLHTLSVSQHKISSVTINSTGEWLALGSQALGQLLVWEWQSETYVLKQQGHLYDLNVVSYSPDGQTIATGGDDGKLKLWNASTGFCFVTFSDHAGSITAVCFTPQSNAVISSSLDGTVRAFDLIRYRNFRTMTTPSPAQLLSLALDPAGEIVCAGSMEPFDIFVWSLQTGQLLDVLSGHTGPVVSLAFNPVQPVLASCSWDKSVRVWDVFEHKAGVEPLLHTSEVLALAYRPDGAQLVTTTLDGHLHFWDVEDGSEVGTIEGRRDIMGGRKLADLRTAKSQAGNKHFNSLCFSADGSVVLAGGNSKWVCIYEASTRVLIKRFQLSRNRSLDGVLDVLNSSRMTEAGSLDLLDVEEEDSDDDDTNEALPGVKKGDMSSRRTRLAIRTKAVRFSPTGRAWAAASTEGLLIYSLDDALVFDPVELDMDVTKENVFLLLKREEFNKALLMALKLNEVDVVRAVYEKVPLAEIPVIVQSFPLVFLQRLLTFIATELEQSRHLEFHLVWALQLLNTHGKYFKGPSSLSVVSSSFHTTLRALHKAIQGKFNDLSKLCDENMYTLGFLCTLGKKTAQVEAEEDAEYTEEDDPFATTDDPLFTTRRSLF